MAQVEPQPHSTFQFLFEPNNIMWPLIMGRDNYLHRHQRDLMRLCLV